MARWPTGFTMLAVPAGPPEDNPAGAVYGISADGRTAAGWATADSATVDHYRQACYWTPTAGPTFIAPHGSSAVSCSADGSVIVGGADTGSVGAPMPPFRWRVSDGLVSFGVYGDLVYAISADASRIVGATSGTAQPCFWDGSTLARTDLTLLAGYIGGSARAVSADGTYIAGDCVTPLGETHPFRWTMAGGMIDPGLTADATGAHGTGVSDGGIVTGYFIGGDINGRSFTWTPSTGYVLLPAVNLETQGFYAANAISGDGSTVYGYGWFPDLDHDLAIHIAYYAAGATRVPTPTLFPGGEPSADYTPNPGCISREGVVMGGYCDTGGGGAVSMPFVYVAPGLAMDNVRIGTECVLCLDWSDDRGHTFGVPVCQPMSSWGYLTSLQWQRLGYARDRVFRLTWTCDEHTALQGAWYTAIAERRRGKK